MFEKLSESQRNIVNCTDSRIIVKACPGSGKTFSVTARLAKLLIANELGRHQGIATLSFTNTACDEIIKGMKKDYNISEIKHPHYIGTIDSFINNYIFLPYGHLVMRCKERPEIVGTVYNKWFDYDPKKRNFDKSKIVDPNYYFDKVSFNLNNTLLRLLPYQSYHFGKSDWDIPHKKDGSYKKIVSDLLIMKHHHFNEGKAIQSDANYLALRILKNYPQIVTNIVERFPILVVDEAQDTTAIQMAIIDILDSAGMHSIMLIGDPNQAIFEWNTADPDLFLKKYNSEKWKSLELFENRRSSTHICSVINNFFAENMQSVSEDKDCIEFPILKTHQTDNESISNIVNEFKIKCTEMGINEDAFAIVYRGSLFGEKYFNLIQETNISDNSMWASESYFVRDIVYGKYLIDNGSYKKGIHLLEKGLLKKQYNLNYISLKFIQEEVVRVGFRVYLNNLHEFINKLPQTNQTLRNWILESNKLGVAFNVNNINADIDISHIFHDVSTSVTRSSFYKTIHSVKGMSLDAILVFLVKKDHSNYSTILSQEYSMLANPNKEQLRIVYVACSRPKKILWIAVPSADIECWKSKLRL